MHVYTNVYAVMYSTCATQNTLSCSTLCMCVSVRACRACVSMRVIGGGADVGTDCRESRTTCSISGFFCLGEPPCIYTPAWLTAQPAPLTREPLI